MTGGPPGVGLWLYVVGVGPLEKPGPLAPSGAGPRALAVAVKALLVPSGRLENPKVVVEGGGVKSQSTFELTLEFTLLAPTPGGLS